MDSKARGSVIKMIIIRTCTQRAGKLFTGFVLGCIEDDVWNQIFFGKLSPRSTQFHPFCSSLMSTIRQLLKKTLNFAKFCHETQLLDLMKIC